MPEFVPLHEDRHEPEPLGDAWVLRKGNKTARCYLQTPVLGWELVVVTTDVIRTQVCKTSEEALNTQKAWKTALVKTAWGAT